MRVRRPPTKGCTRQWQIAAKNINKENRSMSKELAVKEKAVEFPALSVDSGTIREALEENLGGATLTPFDLDKVNIPAGGAISWEVPGLEGDTSEKELLGIIVHVQNARAYWKDAFGGGGAPPDCVSDDAVTGLGDPGGDCATCPYAVFGSDARQRGQACKLIQRLFLLRPGGTLPLVVNLPPGSLKGARKYLLRLVSAGQKASGVVTRITLEKDKNADGIVFSKATFAMAGKLDESQGAAARSYGQAIAPYFRRAGADDFQPEVTE
jgi:hypothetical protein